MLEDLALPAAADVLRLAPGVAVSTTGPRGTQTQVRIRGAEANHSLLFVDGIRFIERMLQVTHAKDDQASFEEQLGTRAR